MQQTPFQKLGYTDGDVFTYHGTELPLCTKKRLVKLVNDLGTTSPLFKRINGKGMDSAGKTTRCIPLKHLKKVEFTSEVVAQPVTGIKFDSDKLEFSLLPKGVLQPILRVLGFGKKKYAADNWQRVDNARERYFNAIQRHLTSWWEGEKTDPETGENHLAHAACCILFLLWFDNQTTGKG